MKTMRAARLHEVGALFQVDEIPVPEPRATDVLVRVKACGVVPNLHNVVAHYPKWFPFLPLPKLPAIYGLDAAGVVEMVGSHVRGIKPGDRVYVNPGLSCGSCPACRRRDNTNCPAYTFQGYFGFGPGSQQIYEDYPCGGFSEFMTAPATNLVRLPESVSFEQGARFGYIGTAYAGLRKAGLEASQTLIIDGATGTLGLGGTLCALAMGARTIFATGRNKELLAQLKELDPARIHPVVIGERSVHDIVMEATEGYGVDVVLQALGPGAPVSNVLDSFSALRRGGKAVSVGGVSDPIPLEPFPLMCQQKSFIGSLWFTPAEGENMAAMADSGALDLSVFEHEVFPLKKINEALDAVNHRHGGFTNVVINPSQV
ncbi:alcohol dehydrogenase catalytic domain-containing protein [Paraburkholderia sp. SIMBA_054]|uniref:alcohol dehydrogenase catalytic domain-containing protein n=1 Tax=Paraburkholderia sp. SIMBA_054 TaxID=3085795 RepID=UPI00397849BF